MSESFDKVVKDEVQKYLKSCGLLEALEAFCEESNHKSSEKTASVRSPSEIGLRPGCNRSEISEKIRRASGAHELLSTSKRRFDFWERKTQELKELCLRHLLLNVELLSACKAKMVGPLNEPSVEKLTVKSAPNFGGTEKGWTRSASKECAVKHRVLTSRGSVKTNESGANRNCHPCDVTSGSEFDIITEQELRDTYPLLSDVSLISDCLNRNLELKERNIDCGDSVYRQRSSRSSPRRRDGSEIGAGDLSGSFVEGEEHTSRENVTPSPTDEMHLPTWCERFLSGSEEVGRSEPRRKTSSFQYDSGSPDSITSCCTLCQELKKPETSWTNVTVSDLVPSTSDLPSATNSFYRLSTADPYKNELIRFQERAVRSSCRKVTDAVADKEPDSPKFVLLGDEVFKSPFQANATGSCDIDEFYSYACWAEAGRKKPDKSRFRKKMLDREWPREPTPFPIYDVDRERCSNADHGSEHSIQNASRSALVSGNPAEFPNLRSGSSCPSDAIPQPIRKLELSGDKNLHDLNSVPDKVPADNVMRSFGSSTCARSRVESNSAEDNSKLALGEPLDDLTYLSFVSDLKPVSSSLRAAGVPKKAVPSDCRTASPSSTVSSLANRSDRSNGRRNPAFAELFESHPKDMCFSEPGFRNGANAEGPCCLSEKRVHSLPIDCFDEDPFADIKALKSKSLNLSGLCVNSPDVANFVLDSQNLRKDAMLSIEKAQNSRRRVSSEASLRKVSKRKTVDRLENICDPSYFDDED